MTLVGIFAAIALPRFNNSTMRYRVDSAARRVIADLDYARQQAIATSRPLRVTFDVTTDQYTLAGVADLKSPGSTYAVALGTEPYRVDLASPSFGGSAWVQFDIFGRPSSSGSVVVQIGATRRTVSLNQTTGKASMS